MHFLFIIHGRKRLFAVSNVENGIFVILPSIRIEYF